MLACVTAQKAKAAPATLGSIPTDEKAALHAKDDFIENVIFPSDVTWAVFLLESDERCGESCAKGRSVIAQVDEKAQGQFRVAYVNAHDPIQVQGDVLEAHQVFNTTDIPRLMIFPAGPKAFESSVRLDAQTAGSFLGSGAKGLYQGLQIFVPSTVANVRHGSYPGFLTKPIPSLPRVLLLSPKREISALYRALSVQLSSRAMFGQALADDAKLKEMMGLADSAAQKGSVLYISGPGPHPTPNPPTPSPSPSKASKSKKDKKKDSKKTTDTEAEEETASPSPSASASPSPSGPFVSWIKYEGPMTLEALRPWLDEKLDEVSIPQLRSQADFDKACGENPDVTVCFIAVLPKGAQAPRPTKVGLQSSIKDTLVLDEGDGETNAQLAMAALKRSVNRALVRVDWSNLQAASTGLGEVKATTYPASYSWVDSDAQDDFVSAFDAQTPGLIAINPRKKAYALYRGTFTAAGLYEFLVAMMEPVADYIPKEQAAQLQEKRRSLIKMESVKTIPGLVTQPAEQVKQKKTSSSGGEKKKKTKKTKKVAEKEEL